MAVAAKRGGGGGGAPASSSNLIIAGSVLVGFFLIAVWVFTAPSAIPDQPVNTLTTAPEETVTTPTNEPVKDTTPDVEVEDETPTESSTPPAVPSTELPDTISTQAELTTENREANTTEFETQAAESKEEKGLTLTLADLPPENVPPENVTDQTGGLLMFKWKVCAFEGAQDFIPCLDNEAAIKKLKSRKHYQHRERHCFSEEELPKCLLPLPADYKSPIRWPFSRNQVWFSNVPHTQLVSYKADQNWVKVSKDQKKLIFPGGGTQFKHGATHYIDFLEESMPEIAWGRHTRVILDVGCGVASFGGYLFDRDVLAMSVAPKDEHEAQEPHQSLAYNS